MKTIYTSPYAEQDRVPPIAPASEPARERSSVSPIALAFGAGAALGFLLGRGGKGAFGIAARAGFNALAGVVVRQLALTALAPIVVSWFDREAWTPVAPPRSA